MRRNKSLNGEKIMNVFRYMVVSIFACCALECLQAANEIPPRAKKHYLDEGMISVTKEGISIRTEEGFVGARAIRSDKHGIFVYESDMTNVGNVCEKKIHACYCRNPGCRHNNHIFYATKWRKYCSPHCAYEAVATYGCRPG